VTTTVEKRISERKELSRRAFVKGHMARFREHLLRRAFLVVMMAGAALITIASLEYFDFGTLPAFMIEKLPLKFRSLWLVSLRVHVASAIVAFPLCLLLMTRTVQRRRAVHRWVGRVTGTLVLFLLVPTGALLAFDAKGGAFVTAGFLLSGAIVGWFMVSGVLSVRRGELSSHRRAMRHVVGQMSVAVTSRALMMALDAYGMDPDQAYVIALWGPVLASAAMAELVSWRPGFLPSIERISREISPFRHLVRVRSVVRPLARFGR
jgi:uncharacterized membrane protein YozB (DUF420 family)